MSDDDEFFAGNLRSFCILAAQRTLESDDEDYGFEYEDEDDFDEDDPEIVLQNTFYESKGVGGHQCALEADTCTRCDRRRSQESSRRLSKCC